MPTYLFHWFFIVVTSMCNLPSLCLFRHTTGYMYFHIVERHFLINCILFCHVIYSCTTRPPCLRQEYMYIFSRSSQHATYIYNRQYLSVQYSGSYCYQCHSHVKYIYRLYQSFSDSLGQSEINDKGETTQLHIIYNA